MASGGRQGEKMKRKAEGKSSVGKCANGGTGEEKIKRKGERKSK